MKQFNQLILGIETSCDDTSVALIEGNAHDLTAQPHLLAFESYSQEKMLAYWGGIVPEIAARNHMEKIVPLLQMVMDKGGRQLSQLTAIAVTTHPGLLGALLTGVNIAKTLSLMLKIPVIPVNHLYAHLEAIGLTQTIRYPYLGLLLSGGHSIFFLVSGPCQFQIIGSTIDDAAGEAFDKGGRLLGLPYPSGRIIDELAQQGDPTFHSFPIGLRHSKNANLSYSGVKTAMRNFLEEHPEFKLAQPHGPYSPALCDLVASYQAAILEAIKIKLKYAFRLAGLAPNTTPVVVGGGVAANSALRALLQSHFPNTHFVEPRFCTDNGAMIAHYGLRTCQHNAIPYPQSLSIDAASSFLSKHDLQQGQVITQLLK